MKKRNIVLVLAVILVVLYIFRGSIIDPFIRKAKDRIKKDFTNAISLEKNDQTQTNKKTIDQIAFISDIHNDIENLESAITQINQSNVSLIYVLGDLTNTGTDKELSSVKNALKKLNKKTYIFAGDHDFWAGRQIEKNPTQIFNNYFSENIPPAIVHHNNIDLLYINNADIYTGVPEEEITQFNKNLSQSNAKSILIISHKAIYHSLTVHKMGYIDNEENTHVLNQAERIQKIISNNKQKNITILNGDLHTSSKYSFLSTAIPTYSIGAVTSERNFQSPRYGIAKMYSDYSIEIINQEL